MPDASTSAAIGAALATARLRATRLYLLEWHKALVDAERERYERMHGRVENAHQMLHLVIQDPWFAWLRPISALIVQADERMADDAPVQMTEARDLGREVRRLLDGDGSAAPFRDAYHRVLQDSPDVVLAHGRLLAHLNEPRS
jgi:hypothetical protein